MGGGREDLRKSYLYVYIDGVRRMRCDDFVDESRQLVVFVFVLMSVFVVIVAIISSDGCPVVFEVCHR